MVYLDMFSNEQNNLCNSFMDPRISFSNDFGDTHQDIKHELWKYKEEPVSSAFEFCFKNNAMIPADEIFSDGMLLPLKDDDCRNKVAPKITTLREELLVDDNERDDGSLLKKLSKSSSGNWWKERLGLKRNHNASKRVVDVMEKVNDEKRSCFHVRLLPPTNPAQLGMLEEHDTSDQCFPG